MLRELEEAIRGNLQGHASALAQACGTQGHDPRGVFDLLRKFAISKDGALHAESTTAR